MAIGFKTSWWNQGKKKWKNTWSDWGNSGSVSKWESSHFGGYDRLIMDYPRVVLDFSVDFDCAALDKGSGYLSTYEKEKILKIFLSKSKNNGLIPSLMLEAKTEKEKSFLGRTVIKTTIDKEAQRFVLDSLLVNEKEKEYAPLFKHYKQFIIDSEICFKGEENNSGGGGSSQNKDDKEKQGEDKEKNQDKKNQNGNGESKDDKDKEKEEKEKEEKENQGKGNDKNDKNEKENEKDKNEGNDENEKDKDKDESQKQNQPGGTGRSDGLTDEQILKNEIDFEKALQEIREEEFKWNSISDFKEKVKTHIQKVGPETTFSSEEILIAERLVKLLDISFDPTEDTVKNLRLGKLDIAKIAEIPAGNIAIYQQKVEDQTTKPFSVCILCDESGSMTQSHKLHHAYHTVKSLFLAFSEILPQDKIFVYGHTGWHSPDLYVYQDPYNQNFITTIDSMLNRNNGGNYDGPVIEEVHKSVRLATQDRIIFIVLSDGSPAGTNYGGAADYQKMRQIIEKCKRDEFVTAGVGILHFSIKDLYQYSTIIDDLSEMPKKVSHLVNSVVKTEFQ